jgi:hypothetical protein
MQIPLAIEAGQVKMKNVVSSLKAVFIKATFYAEFTLYYL